MEFNIGDKVRVRHVVSDFALSYPIGFSPAMTSMQGQVGLITNKIYGPERIYYWLSISEDYAWHEEWLEPEDDAPVFIGFSAKTKEEALRKAKEKIEEVFAPKDWTESDISAARTNVIYLTSKVVSEGGDVCFTKNGKSIVCEVSKDSFCPDSVLTGISTPRGQDKPNDWIGKCVALCSALHEPIPTFITNKNR